MSHPPQPPVPPPPLPPAAQGVPAVPAVPAAHWRRLDSRMLVVHPLQSIVQALPALALFFITGRTSDRSPWWEVGAVAVIVVFGVSRWFTTRYRVTEEAIELRSGLLFRRASSARVERVRTVDVTASVWHRMLGLTRVVVGTAGGAQALGSDRFILDSLPHAAAEQLREELLHRRDRLARLAPASPIGTAVDDAPDAPEQIELVRLHLGWLRYAPLTTSGLVSAAAIWGAVAQYLADPLRDVVGELERAVQLGAGLAVVLLAVLAVLAVAGLAVTAYLSSYWGFRLTRHSGGTLHVTRGLLTTRATSVEERRLRGVELAEPLGLRLARAATLRAVTTGLGTLDADRGAGLLVPPAPAEVVAAVAVTVVGDESAVRGRLQTHGPAARRRRWARALSGGLVLAAAAVVAALLWPVPVVALVAAALPLLAAPILAADRYAGLGHLLTDAHLVGRSGSLLRQRHVLQRSGVIGVVVRESFFQRRAGLATLVATTSAGRQGYSIFDVPRDRADELTLAVLPVAAEFLVGRSKRADPDPRAPLGSPV